MFKTDSSNGLEARLNKVIADTSITTTDIDASGHVQATTMQASVIDADNIYSTDALGYRVKLTADNTFQLPLEPQFESVRVYDPLSTSLTNIEPTSMTISDSTGKTTTITAGEIDLDGQIINSERIALWETVADGGTAFYDTEFKVTNTAGVKGFKFDVSGCRENNIYTIKHTDKQLQVDLSYGSTNTWYDLPICKDKNLDIGNGSLIALRTYSVLIGYASGGRRGLDYGDVCIGTNNATGLNSPNYIFGNKNTCNGSNNVLLGYGLTTTGSRETHIGVKTVGGTDDTNKCFIYGISPNVNQSAMGVGIITSNHQLVMYDKYFCNSMYKIETASTTKKNWLYSDKIQITDETSASMELKPSQITLNGATITASKIANWDALVSGGEVTPTTIFLDSDFKIRNSTKYLKFDLSGVSAGEWLVKPGGLGVDVQVANGGYYGLVREKSTFDFLDLASGNSGRIRNSAALYGYNNTVTESTIFGYIFGNYNTISATSGAVHNVIVGANNTVSANDPRGNILIGRGMTTRNQGKIETHIGHLNSSYVTDSCFIHGIKNNIDDTATHGVSIDITNHQLKAFDRYKFNNGPVTIEQQTLSGQDIINFKAKVNEVPNTTVSIGVDTDLPLTHQSPVLPNITYNVVYKSNGELAREPKNLIKQWVRYLDMKAAKDANNGYAMVLPKAEGFLVTFDGYDGYTNFEPNTSIDIDFYIHKDQVPVDYELHYSVDTIYHGAIGSITHNFAITSQAPALTSPGNPLLYYYKFRILNRTPENFVTKFYQLSILLKTTLVSKKTSHKITEFVTAKQIFNI